MSGANRPATLCCGEHDWSPAAGEPVVPGCATCPKSPTYWRLPENRTDGQPYAPVPPPAVEAEP